jgi:tetratricopeptide (TPR) repeat protein
MRLCAWFTLAWLTGAVSDEIIVDADGTFHEDESVQSLLSYASSAYKEQHLSRAVELWRRVLTLTPNDENVLLDMGEALLKMGSKQEALEAFKTAIEVNPLNNYAYYDAAEAAATPSEQIGYMKKLVEIDKNANQAGLTGHLGALLLNANRYDEAAVVIQKLVDSGVQKMKDHINL